MGRRVGALLASLLFLLAAACADDSSPTPSPAMAVTTATSTALQANTPLPLTNTPTALEPPAASATPATSGNTITPGSSPTPKVLAITFMSTPGVGGEYAAELEPLGRAYAEDASLTFREVRTSMSGAVAGESDRAQWASRVEEALLAGYKRKSGAFEPVPFQLIRDSLNVEMAGNRTPSQVVQAVLAPGSVVVHATWRFTEGEPVDTYAVFSPDREPLFDTLLSMPLIQIPDFTGDHF